MRTVIDLTGADDDDENAEYGQFGDDDDGLGDLSESFLANLSAHAGLRPLPPSPEPPKVSAAPVSQPGPSKRARRATAEEKMANLRLLCCGRVLDNQFRAGVESVHFPSASLVTDPLVPQGISCFGVNLFSVSFPYCDEFLFPCRFNHVSLAGGR